MELTHFNETGKATGDVGMQDQCTSALFGYQVVGTGAEVEFSGSNMPEPDINDDSHWIAIVTIAAGVADAEPFRQHVWDKVRYKVIAGNDVGIYVTSGVAG